MAPDGSVPALKFLDGCPGKIDAEFTAVLDAVAAGPTASVLGGGKWEAMHGSMNGWYANPADRAGPRAVPAVLPWKTQRRRSWADADCRAGDRGDHRHAKALADGLLRA